MSNFQQQIKERTGWSDAIVRFLHSREEAEVYIRAGLVERRIGGRPALIRRDIDWSAFNCRQEWLKQKFADWDKWQVDDVVVVVHFNSYCNSSINLKLQSAKGEGQLSKPSLYCKLRNEKRILKRG